MHIDSIKNDFNLKDVNFRAAQPNDGLTLWQLVRDTGVLDLNSPYFYVLMATDFGETCLVVEHNEQIVGAIIGYHPPKQKQTVFCECLDSCHAYTALSKGEIPEAFCWFG